MVLLLASRPKNMGTPFTRRCMDTDPSVQRSLETRPRFWYFSAVIGNFSSGFWTTHSMSYPIVSDTEFVLWARARQGWR